MRAIGICSKAARRIAYKCLTGQVTSDSLDWSDGSAIWANYNQTQAYDPISKTNPPTTFSWGNVVADNASYSYDFSTTSLASRLDIQLVNAPMLAAYNRQGGVELAADTSDPFDSSNFPSSRYPYAFEIFGNNGSVPRNRTATNSTNHSLDDLTNTTPNAATIYADLQLMNNNDPMNFTGSDHYPLVADYVIAPSPVILTALGFGTNGYFQVKLTSIPNTQFELQGSRDLNAWTNITSGYTDANGSLTLQDTDPGNYRFYRAIWPVP